jgi:peptidoglycan/LPS O-acetylase OafA/YrhL
MAKAKHYYPELDSLRFFAFLSVLIHHAPYLATVPAWVAIKLYGWMGVDLFLCLSAYLFAKLLFVEFQQRGDINVGYFYLRRALRIWPLYFIFIGLMLGYLAYRHLGADGLLVRSLGLVTFTDNLVTMALGFNIALPCVSHLWTISYEEQFYMVIPWALRFFYRQKAATSLAIIGGFVLFGLALRAVFIHFQLPHRYIWVFPLAHFESIVGGLVVGLGLADPWLKRIPGWFLLIPGIVALWGVTLLPGIDQTNWTLMVTYPLVGLGVSLILAAVVRGGIWPVSLVMKNGAMGYLGKISYGLYVYHLFARELTFKLVHTFLGPSHAILYPVVMVLAMLGVTVLISAVSYQLLERPFLKLKSRFTFVQSRSI